MSVDVPSLSIHRADTVIYYFIIVLKTLSHISHVWPSCLNGVFELHFELSVQISNFASGIAKFIEVYTVSVCTDESTRPANVQTGPSPFAISVAQATAALAAMANAGVCLGNVTPLVLSNV